MASRQNTNLPGGGMEGTSARVHLAAFGKHPGWDDHVDEQGIETELLSAFKKMLYHEGIERSIREGRWENLPAGHREPGYGQVFLFRAGGGLILGRMWSSSDGKSRTAFPMILCAQITGLEMDWGLTRVLPALSALAEQCRATSSAADVIALVDQARQDLRQQATSEVGAEAEIRPWAGVVAEVADQEPMGPGEQGIGRVLYQLERELGPYLRGQKDPGPSGDLKARLMRLPSCSDDPAAALRMWAGLAAGQLASWAPFLLIVREGRPWIDLIVGQSAGAELYCLQTTPAATPLSTDIPYELDGAFVAKVADMVAKSRQGTLKFEEPPAKSGAASVMASVRAAVPAPSLSMTGGRKINWTWIVGGAAALIALLLLILQLMTGETPKKPDGNVPPPNGKANSGGPNLPAPTPSGPSADTRSQWRELCAAYEEGWGEFFVQLNRETATAAGAEKSPAAILWTQAQAGRHLAEFRVNVLQKLQAAAAGDVKLDPRDIYGKREAFATLKLRPPPGGAGPGQIGQAYEVLKSIEKSLADWSARKALSDAKAEYEKLGWALAADETDHALKALATQPPTAVAILGAVQAADRVDAIADMWKKLTAATASAGKMDDPIFKSYPQYLMGQISEPAAPPVAGQALAGLQRRMTGALPLGQAMEDFTSQVWAKVDAAQLPMAAGPGASEADFRKRMEQARGCVKMDPAQDARHAQLATWREDLDQVESALKRLKLMADGQPPKLAPAEAPIGERMKSLAGWLVAMEASVEASAAAATGQQARLATSVKIEIARVRAQIGKLDLPAVERNRVQIEQESSTMRQALGRLKVSVIGDASQWLAGVRKIEKISDHSPVLNDAWARGRTHLLPAADDAKLGQDPATFFDRKSRIEGLQEALGAIDKGFTRGIGQAAGGAWTGEMTRLADEVREGELRKAMNAIGLGTPIKLTDMIQDASWTGLAQQYEVVRKKIEESARATARIGELLEAGYLPDESPAAGEPSISALMETWRKQGAFDPGLRMKVEAALKEPLGLVARVAALSKSPDAAALARQAGELTEPAELRAAWQKLGEVGWPAAARDLESGAALRQKIDDWTRRLGGQRGPILAERLNKEAAERWVKCYGGLKDQKDIELAIGIRGQYAVKDQSLPQKIKFNTALHRMRATAAQWSPQGKPLADPPAQEKIKALAAELEAASAAVQSDAGVAGLLGKIKALAAEPLKAAGQGADGADGAGPASSLVAEALRWEKVEGTPEGQIKYRWKSNKSGRSHELTFHLVPGVGGDAGPIYLASTEMSIGLLIDAVEAAGGWPAMQTLMERGEDDLDPRRGARGWEWVRRGAEMKIADHWLQLLSPTLKQKPELCYPMGVAFTKPDANHPAQYVPAGAAMFVARLVACRLPTRIEWEAALASDDPGLTGTYNLRDQTFARQTAHVKEVTANGDNLDDPEAGIFPAPAAAPGARKAAAGKNDSTLWFEHVGASAGGKYSHLIGNVSELTFDQPEEFAVKFKTAQQMTAPAMKDYLSKEGQAALGVIGGSALSSPDSGAGWTNLTASSASRGYSDVGFRLAYRVPHVPLALRAQRLLEAQPYLSP